MKTSAIYYVLLAGVHGFAPRVPEKLAASRMHAIIKADSIDAEVDEGRGGVRLAQESAIKLLGTVKHGPGKAEPEVENLIRYKQVQEVDDATVKKVLKEHGLSLVTTGMGKEVFKDPGETTVKEFTYAPDEAARDALMGAGSLTEAKELVINFLGSEDLILDQVLNALRELVLDLAPPTKCKISYNSLSHDSFPVESATVTVVSRNKAQEDEVNTPTGRQKSVAGGEVYFRDGKWWTVTESDINTSLE